MQKSENLGVKNFRSLIAWQRAHTLSLTVYKLTRNFPAAEQYALTSQMRRAAVSVTSNIAEGYGRVAPKDKHHFYVMASGSAREIQSQLSLAMDLGYISEEEFMATDMAAEEVLRLLNGLQRSVSAPK